MMNPSEDLSRVTSPIIFWLTPQSNNIFLKPKANPKLFPPLNSSFSVSK